MLEALVQGTTAVLADLARGKLRTKLPALCQALAGRFRAHHAFLVGQMLAHLDYVDEAIATLSQRLEELLIPFAETLERLDAIPGINRRTAEVLVAELGVDMTVFPTAAHLASWAGLCGALAQHRDARCQASEADIMAALTGHYRPEHVFVLQQNLELFDAYQRQLAACDAAIETHIHTLAAQAPAPASPLPAPRTRKKPRDNEPRFDIRTPLHHLTGVDLTQLDAIGPYSALRLLAEIGPDMSRWPTEKHFTSWLTLAPHNKITGGRLLSSATLPSANRAAGILRMAAMSRGRTETALGAFYRRLAFRVGKAKAITATARKLAILVYRTLKDGLVYHDPGAAAYDTHTASASFAACVSAPPISDSHWSITKPASCSRVQFLRSFLGEVDNAWIRSRWSTCRLGPVRRSAS